jgi:hypothetical protein
VLHELNCAHPVNDTDKSFWQLRATALSPEFKRYIREVPVGCMAPGDCSELMDSRVFMDTVFSKRAIRNSSIEEQQSALNRTLRFIDRIDAWLAGCEAASADSATN